MTDRWPRRGQHLATRPKPPERPVSACPPWLGSCPLTASPVPRTSRAGPVRSASAVPQPASTLAPQSRCLRPTPQPVVPSAGCPATRSRLGAEVTNEKGSKVLCCVAALVLKMKT